MLHASHGNPYAGGNAVLDAMPQDDARALFADARMGHADAADLLLIGGGTIHTVEQSVACSTAHHVGERAARWVLTIAHQIGRDDFVLRREFLAMMLALPESSAARGIATLAYLGAVRYENEWVTILDRARLCEVACECFEAQRRYRAAIASSHDGTVPPRR